MSTDTENKSYTTHLIQDGDEEDVTKLLKKTFYVDEPLNETIDLWSENSPCPELDYYCKSSLLEGLSFKAVDQHGNIVGLTISGITQLHERNGIDMQEEANKCKHSKFQKIMYILAQREIGAKLWEKFPDQRQIAEVKVAATDPSWRRRGIMNKLVEETEKAIQNRGVKVLRMDTSSAYSAKSAERLGFSCVYKAAYKDILRDGVPIIVPKEPHIEDRVYVKVFNNNL